MTVYGGLSPGTVNSDGCVAGSEEHLRKGGGKIVDLHGVISLGVRVGDVGVDLVSRSQHGSSFTMRMLATLSSPSAQAIRIVVVPTRGSPTHHHHRPQRQYSSTCRGYLGACNYWRKMSKRRSLEEDDVEGGF